ncbi:stemmadenine O-acetyltransferase [Gossypium hirsutum]|uniref:Stemmadenine O-acetyltransferase n=1 Tax=Gossypium hirsutum TaxID=3635 RepID=A0ABM3AD16_GOSHI|nr:stemmadenine O-acetyltransferase-like [Gossypium hirsutum]
MKLDVEVVSEEILKPSSPTPDRLRRYRLSFLDQLNPLLYNHLVYFYPKICDTEANKITILDRLKHSMSNALTYFYPLAGRMMEGRLSIDCNDEGIPFVEVRVKCKLSDAINNVVPKELNILLPFEIHGHKEILLGIQFNVFDCGGIGIGVCVSHKISDAL